MIQKSTRLIFSVTEVQKKVIVFCCSAFCSCSVVLSRRLVIFFYVTPLLHVAVPHKLCWWNRLPCRTAGLEFCKLLKQKHTQVTSSVIVIVVSSMLHLRYRSAKCWHQSLQSGLFWAVSSFSFREFHIVLNSCRARFARTSHWSSVVRGRSCWSWSCLTFMRRAQTGSDIVMGLWLRNKEWAIEILLVVVGYRRGGGEEMAGCFVTRSWGPVLNHTTVRACVGARLMCTRLWQVIIVQFILVCQPHFASRRQHWPSCLNHPIQVGSRPESHSCPEIASLLLWVPMCEIGAFRFLAECYQG